MIHVNATLQLLGTSPTDAASCFADAPNAAAGRQGKAIQLVSVVTRVRRVPGLAALLALAMLLTQAFVAPFPLGFAANGNPLALAAVAPSPRPTCGDMGANCGHPGSPHTVDCPSGADCAVMHGWVGVLAQHLPTPAPLATSYFAARLGRYAGSSTVPPIPPPRHLV